MRILIDKDDTLKIIADTISLYGTGTKVESEILSIVSKIPCEEPWNIVKSTLNELERKIDELILNYANTRWIPVTERLPEEDKEVLITYKGKVDELDKPYSNIDITTYGQMYFGGNKVGNYKHWRSPFQYFNDNYEVTAWQPLPEPYKEGQK